MDAKSQRVSKCRSSRRRASAWCGRSTSGAGMRCAVCADGKREQLWPECKYIAATHRQKREAAGRVNLGTRPGASRFRVGCAGRTARRTV